MPLPRWIVMLKLNQVFARQPAIKRKTPEELMVSGVLRRPIHPVEYRSRLSWHVHASRRAGGIVTALPPLCGDRVSSGAMTICNRRR